MSELTVRGPPAEAKQLSQRIHAESHPHAQVPEKLCQIRRLSHHPSVHGGCHLDCHVVGCKLQDSRFHFLIKIYEYLFCAYYLMRASVPCWLIDGSMIRCAVSNHFRAPDSDIQEKHAGECDLRLVPKYIHLI